MTLGSPIACRLAPLAVARTEEKLAMSHIFIQAAGMTQGQIDAVTFGRGGKTAPRTPAFGLRLGAWWRAILRTAN
jgi:hypothetical protein